LRPAKAGSLGDFTSKITRTKWTGGVAQAEEYLVYKCEALSSNPGPTKKKEKRTCLLVQLLFLHFYYLQNLSCLFAITIIYSAKKFHKM
jgi:hypothetical protein